tara:strand:+ start:6520 stop:7395 length:876 start_codon:yes stop_codon:yes gene_type:complete
MKNRLKIQNNVIDQNNPTFIIAEIGLNHNGNLEIAKELIDVAVAAGCDAVKFQKRDPELCVPKDQRDIMRETPWGYISYFDYRYKIEFEKEEYDEIDLYCKDKNIFWTASCWDTNSFDFLKSYIPPFHKVASALLTNDELIEEYAQSGIPTILSTGMSTIEEIDHAVKILKKYHSEFALLHCTSTYPCSLDELNLNVIKSFLKKYDCIIGYSGHEPGLIPTITSVALGARIIERHITLDRSMWGSDQSASIEPNGLIKLVQSIREIERALGNGDKIVYESEIPIREKLRIK